MRSADARAPRPLSLWALASMVTSGLLCPPLCAIGVGLGLVGLAELRMHPERRGRGLAWAGIIVGAVASAGWGGAAWWWHVNIRRPILDGPHAALASGVTGDVTAFTDAFTTDDAADAARFLGEIRDRYGGFRTMRQDPAAETADGMIDRVRPRIAYEITFERGTVPAEAVFVVRDDARLVLRFASLVVRDPDRGDLAYPSAVSRDDQGGKAAGEGASGGASEGP